MPGTLAALPQDNGYYTASTQGTNGSRDTQGSWPPQLSCMQVVSFGDVLQQKWLQRKGGSSFGQRVEPGHHSQTLLFCSMECQHVLAHLATPIEGCMIASKICYI